jgi:hypothetical protein
MTPNDLTDFSTEPQEAGKGGEGGVFQITNADFVAAVFPILPERSEPSGKNLGFKRSDTALNWPVAPTAALLTGSLK